MHPRRQKSKFTLSDQRLIQALEEGDEAPQHDLIQDPILHDVPVGEEPLPFPDEQDELDLNEARALVNYPREEDPHNPDEEDRDMQEQ